MEILKAIKDQIILHAKTDLPNECCGYLAGEKKLITKAYPITNIDQTHDHFSFDPEEQFAAIKDIRNKDLVPIAVYHSHPETPARPSKEDIKLAYDPEISYVIISLAKEQIVIKSFKIRNNIVEKEEIEIL